MTSNCVASRRGLESLDSKYSEKNTDSSESTVTDTSSLATPFDSLATKRLLRKLDLHLIPFLALLYLLCFLDRTNVGNARLVKLEEHLGLKGLDYNLALAVFFPFYIIAEIPSNILMKRLRPSIWLTIIIISWGLIMICMGLVKNLNGLLACRALLGFAEGGLFPGVSYLITMWYRRHECGFRIALFFSAATAAGAFGGLIARGIAEMDGFGNISGWSWIFILEGLLTLLAGSLSHSFIYDYPATAKFLTIDERIEVQRRLTDDDGLSDEFHAKFFYQALRDKKIWAMMFITIGIFTPMYSISLFLPTIITQFGYSTNKSQLLSVPPYLAACFCTILGNYAADKSRQRGVFLLGFEIIAVIGFLLIAISDLPHVQYVGFFFAASGIYPLVPLVTTWNSNNIGGSLKRGVGIAMQVGFGNFGGVIAGFVYLSKDEPRFVPGHLILIALVSMSFIITSYMTLYFRHENVRRDAQLATRNISLEDCSNDMKLEERDKGDNAVFFRYTV
ncbi:hypothetical protein Golomagni_02506 [Golovinomyces magnicellulatus]|nr:hypothetical protein Golomagni_02506 [Golovinomyces magnicellulatus]